MLSCYILNGVPVWLDTGNITTLFFEPVIDVKSSVFSVNYVLKIYMHVNGTRICIGELTGLSKSNLDELPIALKDLMSPCKVIITRAVPEEDASGIIHKYIEEVIVPCVRRVILE